MQGELAEAGQRPVACPAVGSPALRVHPQLAHCGPHLPPWEGTARGRGPNSRLPQQPLSPCAPGDTNDFMGQLVGLEATAALGLGVAWG